MSLNKYFEMVFDDISPGGNADAPDEIYYDYYDEIKNMDFLTFSFKLDNNIFEDFIMNNLDLPLMSSRLKSIFDDDKNISPSHRWLPANVVSKSGKISFKYFLLIFTEKPDVLDFDRTRLIDGDYIYGYFLYEKIKHYSFFPQPRNFDATLIISLDLKRRIAKDNINGVAFREANISYSFDSS